MQQTETKPGWGMYYQLAGTGPTKLAKAALICADSARNRALDLGSGNWRDTNELLIQGFKQVVAVDSSPDVPKPIPQSVIFKQMRIEDYLPGMAGFDIALCVNTTYFMDKKAVERLITRIRASLRPGGIFAFNLLDADDPRTQGEVSLTGFTRSEAEALAKLYKAEHFEPSISTSVMPKMADEWRTWQYIIRQRR